MDTLSAYSRNLRRAACLLVFLSAFLIHPPARAVMTQASCSVTPNTLTKNTMHVFTFTLTNTDPSATIRHVKITRPSSAVTVVDANAGWSSSFTETSATFTSGTLAPGASNPFEVYAQSGDATQAETPWVVEVSDAADGSDPVRATGTLGLTVGMEPDTTPPVISNVNIVEGATSISMTWVTDEPATSVVNYGRTASYGSVNDSLTLATSHTATLSDLSSDTVYYFEITGSDSSNNTATPYQSYAVTLKPGVTITPTPSPTAGATSTPTAAATATPTSTPTPTPTPDTAPPLLQVNPPELQGRAVPEITGVASDNVAVRSVSYSADGMAYERVKTTGKNPLKFAFRPTVKGLSGKHSITVRATDASGNTTTAPAVSFVLDHDPPRISVDTVPDKVVRSAPHFAGKAEDGTGVAEVQWSFDGGKTWQLAPGSLTGTTMRFSCDVPDPAQEGTYSILFRATDTLGNTATTDARTFTVDRLPPKIGLTTVLDGILPVTPESPDSFFAIPGHEYTFIVSTTGGVASGSMTIQPQAGTARTIPMETTSRTGVWQASFTPDAGETYRISAAFTDNINPPVTAVLSNVRVINPSCVTDTDGRPVARPRIVLQSADGNTGSYRLYNGAARLQTPIQTPENGCFAYYVPSGTYRLEVTADGFTPAVTDPVSFDKNGILTGYVQLEKRPCLNIGPAKICMPGQSDTQTPLRFRSGQSDGMRTLNLASVEKDGAPLSDWQGKRAKVVVLNTWMPGIADITDLIDAKAGVSPDSVVVVVPQESALAVTNWKRQAGYSFAVAADPDGTVTSIVGTAIGPVGFTLDRDGSVRGIATDIGMLLLKED